MTTKHRWLRLVVPFVVVAVLFAISGIAHAVEQPDIGDAGTFSPTGTGPDGSSRLAELLAERRIPVERLTTSLDVVRSALPGGATVFIPAPDMPNANLARVLAALPTGRGNRIVLVEPGWRHQSGLPVFGGPTRWAPRTPGPSCTDPVATNAGRATATRTAYVTDPETTLMFRCYGGGLIGVRWQHAELVVVGASDPFRNARIGEHGNAELAAGILSTKDRVIWLDMHAPEPVSYSVFEGGLGIDLPDADQGGGGSGEGGVESSPLWTAVPAPFWPILVQLAIVALILALWRARRLGPPVAEPLPVVVPAAETVTGRGRLYERADARGPALDALRAAARHRVQRLLDLPPEAAEALVVAAVAARTRTPADQVRTLLYGPEPDDDGQLLAAARSLAALVHAVTHERRAAQ